MKKNNNVSIIVVTGISGAGKSQAISFFEDSGFFCIDNLPLELFDKIIELYNISGKFSKIALGIDTRTNKNFEKLFDFVSNLKKKKIDVKIVFLDAKNEILIRRFSETKRKHPLSGEGEDVFTGLKRERIYMQPVIEKADFYIDTSNFSISLLKNVLSKIIKGKIDNKKNMNIDIIAFGYKYGLPENADIVIDVRFLPNPFYLGRLRKKNGLSIAIKNYIFKENNSRFFLKMMKNMLKFLIPKYLKEGKSYLTIAFGCTGGQHRSIAVSDEISKYLTSLGYNVKLHLRDIGKIYFES